MRVAALALAAIVASAPATAEYAYRLQWTPPTTNVDGTPLTDLAGFRVYHGCAASGQYEHEIAIDDPGATSHVVDGLTGDCYLVATAITERGLESVYSNEAAVAEADALAKPGIPSVTIEWRESLMAISLVQRKSVAEGTNTNPHTLTFDSVPTEGNLLVATIAVRNNDPADTIDIGPAAGWAMEINQGIGFRTTFWWKLAGSSESDEVTIDTTGGGAASGCMFIAEYASTTGWATPIVGDQTGVEETPSNETIDLLTVTGEAGLVIGLVGLRRTDETPSSNWAFSNMTLVEALNNPNVDIDTLSDDPTDLSWATAELTGAGSLSSTASWTTPGGTNFRAAGGLILFEAGAGGDIAATGAQSFGSSAALNATGSLAATGAIAFASSADLDATGTLSAAGALAFGSSADLDAIGELAATGAIAFGSAADLTSAANNDLAATGAIAFGSSADLTAIGSLASVGAIAFTSSADLTAPTLNDISATGQVAFGSSADLDAIGEMAAAGALVFAEAAELNATGALAGLGALLWGSSADLDAVGTLDAAAAMAFGGTGNLTAVGALLSAAAMGFSASASLTDANAGVIGEINNPGITSQSVRRGFTSQSVQTGITSQSVRRGFTKH